MHILGQTNFSPKLPNAMFDAGYVLTFNMTDGSECDMEI